MDAESRLQRLTKRFYVNEGEHQDDFRELSIPAERSLGDAVRALRCRIRSFGHPALRVAFRPDERVLS